MKTMQTTVRLPKEIARVVEERAKEEGLDRTAALREFLEEAIKMWKIEEGIRLYKEGKLSLSAASKKAGLPLGEMMEELVKKGVKSDLTTEEYKESLNTAFGLFK